MSFENIWLTIIIPIFNAEKHLHKCLDSIISQSFGNYEVIMVDDGSTDKSSDICRKYSSKDNRFKYFRTENQGVLAARIYGAKLVNGKYFTYCDADDFYADNKVFQLLFDKVSNTTENISLVQFGYISKYNHMRRPMRLTKMDNTVNANTFYMRDYPKLLCSFWEQSSLNTTVWNKLYSRKLLCYLPENPERVFWGEDLILNLHLLQSIENACYLSDMLYVYQQATGETNKFSKHTMKDLDIIKKYQLQFLDKRTRNDTEIIRKILYSEMAGWFLSYLKDAAKHLNDQELHELITDTLLLPRFKLANEFYMYNPENWEGASLLKKADIDEYINIAKKPTNSTFWTHCIHFLKMIYKRI